MKTHEGGIAYVRITGDFFLHPEELIFEIESSLLNKKADEDEISLIIDHVLSVHHAQLIGATPGDFAKVIVEASK